MVLSKKSCIDREFEADRLTFDLAFLLIPVVSTRHTKMGAYKVAG